MSRVPITFVSLLFLLLAHNAEAAEQEPLSPLTIVPGEIISSSLQIDGAQREFLYRLPNGYDPDTKHPVILLLHGNRQPLDTMVSATAVIQPEADRDGAILVYPAFDYSNYNTALAGNLKFVSSLLEKFSSETSVDQGKVFVAGGSAGGMMAFVLACEIPDRIAAFSMALYQPTVSLLGMCSHAQPLPVVLISGTEDPLVPFEGSSFTNNGWSDRQLSAEEYVVYWLYRNEIRGSEPTVVDIEDRVVEVLRGEPVESHIVQYSWSGSNSNDLIWLKVVNGGHSTPEWNNGLPIDPATLVSGIDLSANGTINSDYSSLLATYRFFMDHGKYVGQP